MNKTYPDGTKEELKEGSFELIDQISDFIGSFETIDIPLKITSNGLFGYFTHEAVEHFETITLKERRYYAQNTGNAVSSLPVTIIAIDHFKNELYIFHNSTEGEDDGSSISQNRRSDKKQELSRIQFLKATLAESSNLSDEGFMAIVEKNEAAHLPRRCFPDSYHLVLSLKSLPATSLTCTVHCVPLIHRRICFILILAISGSIRLIARGTDHHYKTAMPLFSLLQVHLNAAAMMRKMPK